MAMHEHEAKLLMEDAPVPEPADLFAGLGEWADESIVLDATYFDTADLRLTRAGVSMRWRTDGAWTVKTPVDQVGTILVRHEHEFAGPSDRPPAVVQELVLAWTRGAPVAEVARISTQRRRLHLLVHAEPWVEIDDDEVMTTSAMTPPATFHEVEIELRHPEGSAQFETIFERIRAAGGRPDAPLPKIVRALCPDALRPPDAPAPDRIGRDASLGDLFRWHVATSVRRFVDYDHLVRLGQEPRAVHQARIATRRLRTDLKLFAPVLMGSTGENIQIELQWIAELLGGVRDTDVMVARLSDCAGVIGGPSRRHDITEQLEQTRTERRSTLLDAMASARYTSLLDDLIETVNHPPLHKHRARRRASKHAPDLARRPWKKLQRTVRALPPEPDDDQLHDVRKRAKQLRYAVEAIEPVAGAKVRRLSSRASRLQDILGEHHDAVVAAQWLAETATSAAGDDAFISELAASFRSDAERTKRQWRRAWKKTRDAHADL